MKSALGFIGLSVLSISCGSTTDASFDDSVLGGRSSAGAGAASGAASGGRGGDAGSGGRGGSNSAGGGSGSGSSGGPGTSGAGGASGASGASGEGGQGAEAGQGGAGTDPVWPEVIYVATTGSDAAGCGVEPQAACKTISKGVARGVEARRSSVYVQAGTYTGVVVLAPGVSVIGGFDTAWQRGEYVEAAHRVVIEGDKEPTTGQYVAVWAHELSEPAALQNLRIVAPVAQGQKAGSHSGLSSYGVHAVSAQLSLSNVEIVAGNGANGAAGADGQDASTVVATDAMHGGAGAPGAANSAQIGCNSEVTSEGGPGGSNACAGAEPAPEMSGGKGGYGGARDTRCDVGQNDYTAQAGGEGADATNVVGDAGKGGGRGSGGGPVTVLNPTACGVTGGGTAGVVQNGVGGKAKGGGQVASEFWYSAQGGSGGAGKHGGGGGGGGGSGACDAAVKSNDSRGAGGGGGGAGGCSARGSGEGGGGGGGSFGIFALGSTIEVTGVSVTRGRGGDGGAGGKGGQGQSGGLGSDGGAHPGTATPGKGGAGGHGGHGGGGAGGAGGPSYAVALDSGSELSGALTIAGGAGGKGGAGGASAPNAVLSERDGYPGEVGSNGALGNELAL